MGFIATDMYSTEGISDYWRLCDEFTIRQTALLIIGIDPQSEAEDQSEYGARRPHEPTQRPKGYQAAVQAVSTALKNSLIKGRHFEKIDFDMNGNNLGFIEGTTDVDLSTVERDSVAKWMMGRGIRHGFFQPITTHIPGYLEPENPRYAPKLAAAVNAWIAVTDPKNRTPKQALDKWLREHAAEFGLSDDEGKPYEAGIEEVAKVANWKPGGGATKTPGN